MSLYETTLMTILFIQDTGRIEDIVIITGESNTYDY